METLTPSRLTRSVSRKQPSPPSLPHQTLRHPRRLFVGEAGPLHPPHSREDDTSSPRRQRNRAVALSLREVKRGAARSLKGSPNHQIRFADNPNLSSSMDNLDGVPLETYCVWEPCSSPSSPTGWKKTSSTGSGSRRWRLRDLVRRSHGDVKEKFVFLSETAPPVLEKTGNPSGIVEDSCGLLSIVSYTMFSNWGPSWISNLLWILD